MTGRVIVAKDATHFAGSSELSIELTRIDTVDHPGDVVTDVYEKQARGGERTRRLRPEVAPPWSHSRRPIGRRQRRSHWRGQRRRFGRGVNGVTKGQQVQIPTETLVSFHLQTPISVTTSKTGGDVGRRGRFATATVARCQLVEIGCRWREIAGPSPALLMTQTRAGQGLMPRLRRSDHLVIPLQPIRAGLTFSGRPSGPRIHGDFALSSLSKLALSKNISRMEPLKCRPLAYPRDDKRMERSPSQPL